MSILGRTGSLAKIKTGEVSNRTLGILLVLPAAVLLVALIVVPMVTTIYSSFFQVNTATRVFRFVGLDNYIWLFTGNQFFPALGRTIVWTTLNIIGLTFFGILSTMILHTTLRGRSVVRGIALFPYVIPAVIAALAWRFALNDALGVINYLVVTLGLSSKPIIWLGRPESALWVVIAINIWKYTPFMMVVFLARLQVIPLELYDAAKIDGANVLQEFWHVTMPWLWPVVFVAMLIRTIWVSTEFDLIYLLAFGGPLGATTTLPILIRNIAIDQYDSGKASAVAQALAMILIAVSIVFIKLYQRARYNLES